ncbi:uncharacterized protein LOC118801000 isoform X2 [Colossoma macropomum]|uniref:uncharacterized protein LOC118801000 isoform X2 n=1 Tax=Colossoma macropomum TaxID=42526 RepID=UPI001863F197|nr:uncharacterized protein LOC118801000 isoform X2 [Colossoma macropomum]
MASTSSSPSMQQGQCRPCLNSEENPASVRLDSGLPALLILIIRGVYIRAGGRFGSYQFTNTFVLDSILTAFHFSFIKYPNVKSLLESNISLRVIMAYLNTEKFDDAKALWMRLLKHFPEKLILDCKSRVKDHLLMFAKLVCAQVDYHQETPDDSTIYETTLSKFRAFGDVKALGLADDPALILVNRDVRINLPKPPLSVEDDNQRIFELQFLLLCDGTHTVVCFNLSKNVWILYDDDPAFASTSFRLFKFEQELDSYVICLAGYVNITQAEEHKHGIPETGTGAQPFSSG